MIRRVIRYWETTTKTIPSAKAYVDRFTILQTKLKQQRKRIHELENQTQLAQQAKRMTVADHLKKMMSSLTGSPFESRAMRQLKQSLIQHRNQLESKIQQSDTKWEKPRQQIIKLRKQMANQFLSRFVQLEQNLLKNCSLKDTSPDLVEGFNLIHRLLLSTLQKHGVTFFEPKIGEPYNSELHDTTDENQKGKDIKQIVSRGWKIQQKIVKKPIVRLM